MENEEKVLTRVLVKELGLDKLEVITSDMLDRYTSIGDYAFYDCSGLTSVTIPNSVTSIGGSAFYGTAWLANQPDGVIYINQSLYTYKGEMPANTSIVVRDGTTQICGGAFSGCSGLTSVTIPNSVTSIGELAFYGCSGLTSVNIPNSVTSIGNAAFQNCSGLTSVVWNAKNCADFSSAAFYNASQITSFTFGSEVKHIPAYLCYDMDNLTSVTIPNSVTSIGELAFYGCSGLTSVNIPNSVTSIRKYAFEACSGLTSVTIGNSVTSIGSSAFEACSGLTKTNYTGDIAGWCGINFGNYSANPTAYSHNLYINDVEVKDLVIPNGVTSIGDYVFYECSGLTSVKIPNSVMSIGECAFYRCYKLKNVVIGDNVYKKHKVIKNKCKAYKAFNADLTCRDFKYEEGKTYEIDGEPELCNRGFHACLSLTDVFSYYYGDLGKEIVIHEVELEGVSDERPEFDSKVVAKKITIGKRIL